MNKKYLITILLLLVLSITFYGCKNNEKPTPQPQPQPTPVENKTDNTDINVNYNEETIKSFFTSFGQCNTGYKLTFGEDKTIKYDALPKEFVNNTLYNYLVFAKKITSNNNTDSFTKTDLETAVKVIYGNVKYEMDNNFNLGDYSFTFDNASGKYSYTKNDKVGCGDKLLAGYSINAVFKPVYDSKDANTTAADEYVASIYYYDYKYEMNDNGYKIIYYGTKTDKSFENPKYGFIDANPNHFLNYEFIFVKNGSRYAFDRVELVG